MLVVCLHTTESLCFLIKSHRKRYDFPIIFITFARRYQFSSRRCRDFCCDSQRWLRCGLGMGRCRDIIQSVYLALCSWLIETSQTSRIVMSNATVDALGMCFSHIPLLVWLIASSDEYYIRIRESVHISAWASTLLVQQSWAMRRPQSVGRVTRRSHAFRFNLCLFLWDFRSEQERNKYEYIRTSKETFARCHQPRG